MDGAIYFGASKSSGIRELWKCDGTDGCTEVVKAHTDDDPTNFGSMTVIGNTLYFSSNNTNGYSELWKIDGSDAGMMVVKPFAVGGPANPDKLAAVGGTLYFRACGAYGDPNNDWELLKSEGTAAGTVRVNRRERDLARGTWPTPLSERQYYDNWITERGRDLLRVAPRRQPLFLQVNFNGPHPPWDVTSEMAGWYRDVTFPLPTVNHEDPPERHQAVRRN